MTAASARLSRLERQMGGPHGPGLLIIVQAGPSNEEVDGLLEERGIDKDHPNHLIVILRTLYERKDGSVDPSGPKAKIIQIMEKK